MVLISFPFAVSPWVDKPLKSVTHGQCDARPTVTFPASGHHRLLTGTKLYCLVTEARVAMRYTSNSIVSLQELEVGKE